MRRGFCSPMNASIVLLNCFVTHEFICLGEFKINRDWKIHPIISSMERHARRISNSISGTLLRLRWKVLTDDLALNAKSANDAIVDSRLNQGLLYSKEKSRDIYSLCGKDENGIPKKNSSDLSRP